MVNLGSFDAHEVEPLKELEAIPAGQYLAIITESEMKSNKAGTGEYLNLKFQILEGEYKDRCVWSRLNLSNPTEKAVEIARAELSAICRAVGVMAPKDSTELHDLPLLIKVRCKKRDDTGEFTNEISAYHPKPKPGDLQAVGASKTPAWKK